MSISDGIKRNELAFKKSIQQILFFHLWHIDALFLRYLLQYILSDGLRLINWN